MLLRNYRRYAAALRPPGRAQREGCDEPGDLLRTLGQRMEPAARVRCVRGKHRGEIGTVVRGTRCYVFVALENAPGRPAKKHPQEQYHLRPSNNSGVIPRSPQSTPRSPQKHPQEPPKHPQEAPKHPQEPPKAPPGAIPLETKQ